MSHPSPLSLDESRPGDLTSHPSPLSEPGEEGEMVEGYRPISGFAIAGALFSIIALLAFTQPYLWPFPWIAVALNAVALWRIATAGHTIVGRRVALAGLTCALVCGCSSATYWLLEPTRIRAEARAFAMQWFAALREGRTEEAHQLVYDAHLRWPLDEKLKSRYENDPERLAQLDRYVADQPMQTLLSLGERARVRYLGHTRFKLTGDTRRAEEFFAVTGGDGDRASFFIKLRLYCRNDPFTRHWGWNVVKAELLSAAPPGLDETL